MVEQTLSVVGRRMPDKTGVQKVTGAARFVSDISLPGMLIGKVLHSPHAHARIVHVDTSAAERLPGVEAVVTYLDSPKKQYSGQLLNLQSEGGIEPWGVYDVRVLEDKVRYVGDAVAAVAAIDERTAEEALELIRVDYEELPAVFDEIEARLESAPQLHDSVLRRQPDGLPGLETVERNLAVHVAHHAIGDVEQGLREADHVIEEVGYTSKQRPAPLETLHCVPTSTTAAISRSGRSPSSLSFCGRCSRTSSTFRRDVSESRTSSRGELSGPGSPATGSRSAFSWRRRPVDR